MSLDVIAFEHADHAPTQVFDKIAATPGAGVGSVRGARHCLQRSNREFRDTLLTLLQRLFWLLCVGRPSKRVHVVFSLLRVENTIESPSFHGQLVLC